MSSATQTQSQPAPKSAPSSKMEDISKWTQKQWDAAKAEWSKETTKWANCQKQADDRKLSGRRKHNGLPLQFARCILRLWVPLAWLLRRFLRWNRVGVASGNSSRSSRATAACLASFSSSIAAHPERLMLADTAIEARATRAQARIETLGI